MFGIDLFDTTLGLSAMIALLAGTISFLSPCVLPIVPPYLAYMAGTSPAAVAAGGDQRVTRIDMRVVSAAIFFVAGLSTVFLLLGFGASIIGGALLMYKREFAILSGIVIVLFGLHFLKFIQIPLLFKEARIETGDMGGSRTGAYVLGLAFAFGWTPCIGPVLGAILAMAAQEGSLTRSLVMMGAYSAGLGIPFLLAAIFLTRFIHASHGLKRHMHTIERVMGGLLVVVGLMLIFDIFTFFSFKLIEAFPFLGMIG